MTSPSPNHARQPGQAAAEHPKEAIDPTTFYGTIFMMIASMLPLIIWPDEAATMVKAFKSFVTDELGVYYILIGVASMLFVLWVAFSDIGKIKLGEEDPEFSNSSWAAMMFCAGMGPSIMYWSLLEWVYYYQGPPFGVEAKTTEAMQWATSYGYFHWGPTAWSFFVLPAIPIAYFYYNKKIPLLKISQALEPVLGPRLTHGLPGQLIDVFVVFGTIGGAATSIGLIAPQVGEGFSHLFGLPFNFTTKMLVIGIITAIFVHSCWKGLRGGIRFLSDLNLVLVATILIIVFTFGPSKFMLELGIDSLGRAIRNLPVMITNTEPLREFKDQGYAGSGFAQGWTIFYWAWWLVYGPATGLFIAKISKGRTIGEMIKGTLFYGSMGCIIFFFIFGNFGVYLQLTGKLDVMALMAKRPTAVLYGVLDQLPFGMGTVAGLCYTILAIIFTATTFDSISYVLAAITQDRVEDEPMRWNRVFWGLAMSFMPIVLMLTSGDLSTVQTAAVVSGAPLILIFILLMISTVKVTREDVARIRQNLPQKFGDSPAEPRSKVHQQLEKELKTKPAIDKMQGEWQQFVMEKTTK